jgi:hypothetical protein
MKYVSTLIFAVALACSWNLVHQESAINFETHAAIQLKLVDVIRQAVLEMKPAATDIQIVDISTKPIDDHRVKAFFSYKFQEPDAESGELTEQQITGEATLSRNKGVDPNQDHWVMEKVITKTGEMAFKNGLVISPVAVPGEGVPVQTLTPTPDSTPLPQAPTETPYE